MSAPEAIEQDIIGLLIWQIVYFNNDVRVCQRRKLLVIEVFDLRALTVHENKIRRREDFTERRANDDIGIVRRGPVNVIVRSKN